MPSARTWTTMAFSNATVTKTRKKARSWRAPSGWPSAWPIRDVPKRPGPSSTVRSLRPTISTSSPKSTTRKRGDARQLPTGSNAPLPHLRRRGTRLAPTTQGVGFFLAPNRIQALGPENTRRVQEQLSGRPRARGWLYAGFLLRCGARRRELVAGAADRLDVAGVFGVRFYLLADVLDVHVGRTRLTKELPVPEVAHDLLAAVNPPRVGGQEREHVELFGRQLDRFAFREDLPAEEVHPQARKLQGVMLLGRLRI